MSASPATGPFTIKSVSQGLALTGISPEATEPPPSWASVVINGHCTTWNIVQQDGFNVFQFAIDGYGYTGTAVDASGNTIVTATTDVAQNVTWFARYFKSEDAYTIETNDNLGFAWTAPSTSAASSPIEITAVPTVDSDPTQFNPSTSQLFRFYTPVSA